MITNFTNYFSHLMEEKLVKMEINFFFAATYFVVALQGAVLKTIGPNVQSATVPIFIVLYHRQNV